MRRQNWGPQAEEGDGTSTYAPSIDTFTSRASNATYVDSAGLVKTAAKNFLTSTNQMWIANGREEQILLKIIDKEKSGTEINLN